MVGRLRGDDAIARFWTWFEANAEHIRQGVERQDLALVAGELGRRLAMARPGVVHEIGKPGPDTVELILSADGMRANVAGVLELMDAAPRLEGFLFTAFRPRRPEASLTLFERRMTAETFRYVAEEDDDILHLRVFMPGGWPEDMDDEALALAGFLLLDQVLGEYDVMTGVGLVDFATGRAPPESRPLSVLAMEFDAFRAAMTH